MKPSRTFTLAAIALALLGLELVAAVLLAYYAPDSMAASAQFLGILAMSIAGAGGLGAGAMGLRDYGSSGRTSSQWRQVTAGRIVEAKERHPNAQGGGPEDAP